MFKISRHTRPPSVEARQEMVQGFLDGDGNIKPEWQNTEKWLGRIEKMNFQSKLILLLFLLWPIQSDAAEFGRVSVDMKISATILNLATMPLEEALRFCDERGMDCPAIREKAWREGYTETGQAVITEDDISILEGDFPAE